MAVNYFGWIIFKRENHTSHRYKLLAYGLGENLLYYTRKTIKTLICIFMEVTGNYKLRMDYIQKKVLLACAWLITYFSPVGELMLFIGIIVFLDTITGSIVASKKGEFNSKRMFSVVYKTVIYMSAIIISFLAENIFDIGFISKVTAGYIAYTELISIDENSEHLLGKRIFSHLLDKLKRK